MPKLTYPYYCQYMPLTQHAQTRPHDLGSGRKKDVSLGDNRKGRSAGRSSQGGVLVLAKGCSRVGGAFRSSRGGGRTGPGAGCGVGAGGRLGGCSTGGHGIGSGRIGSGCSSRSRLGTTTRGARTAGGLGQIGYAGAMAYVTGVTKGLCSRGTWISSGMQEQGENTDVPAYPWGISGRHSRTSR